MGLVELLKRHEGKTLEFKRDLSFPNGILKTLVAFANTAGGTVVIGVEDGSKNVRGVTDVLASEEKLASLISDSICPHLVPDIEVVPWRNLNVLAVQVYPSNTRPHYMQRLGPEDGVFVRVGSTNRRAGALQIEELKRWNRMDSFDECLSRGLRDLSLSPEMPSDHCKHWSGRKNLNLRRLRAQTAFSLLHPIPACIPSLEPATACPPSAGSDSRTSAGQKSPAPLRTRLLQ